MPAITGTIQGGDESEYVGPISFESLDIPCVGGSNVSATHLVGVVTEDDGALPASFALAGGRWKLIVNGRKSKPFTVPDSGGPYDLNALMEANASGFTRRVFEVTNIDALIALDSLSTNYKANVLQDDNGMYAVYRWNAAATNAHDRATYVRPHDFVTAGLWVKSL